MTSPADHLLQVVIELLVEGGYEGVSVRRVATRAGVSIGAVQHHFPTKDAMLNAAMDRMSQQFQARMESRVPVDASAEEALRAVALELIGAGPDARPATVLWLQRLARGAVDAAMADTHARDWGEVENLLTQLLRGSRPQRGDAWARAEAAAMLALVDGLAPAVLLEPTRMPPERAEGILAHHLDRMLGDS
jgi:AcrR family transcriptional regulator